MHRPSSIRWIWPTVRGASPRSPRSLVAVVTVWAVLLVLAPAVAGQDEGRALSDLPAPRLAGGDRVATGEVVAAEWVAGGARADVVVVVPQDQIAVALATAGLAGRHRGMTVLSATPPRASTVAAVTSTGATRVIVVGGETSLAEGWRAAGLATTEVTAPGGPPAVAAAVARALLDPDDAGTTEGGTAATHAYLAGTGGLPDSLAVGPLAYASASPLLLTAADALDPRTAFVIDQTGIQRVTVVGGTAVVSDGVVAQLAAMGLDVQRIAGDDREQTALALAVAPTAAAPPGEAAADLAARLARGVLLAAGDDPADAASAAAQAVHTGQVLLPPGPQVAQALAAHCGRIGPITVLGGVAAVPTSTDDSHRSAAQRCDGPRAAMTVRVAVATPGAPDSGAAVVAGITGPDGWSSRRLRLIGVAEDPHLGVVIADAVACGAAVVCRTGNTLIIDGQHWDAADAPHRQRILDHAVGSWLGEPVGTTCSGQVMDPLDCPSPPALQVATRERVADRLVPTARLSFAGDVHGERHIARAVAAGGNPLAPVAEHLTSADLAVLNLETPLSDRGTPAAKTFVFRGPPAMATALAHAGVDIVSLANNHALDYGVDALADTLVHTRDAGVATVGAGLDAAQAYAPVISQTPAGTVATIGLTRVLHTRTWEATASRPGLASAYDEAAALAAVAHAREVADHVVVAVHWGTERADCPDATQRRLAVLLSDAGADIIVGHHPHVLQGLQVRGSALIAYSMGNFVWYHNSGTSRFTGILDVELPLLDSPRWAFQPAEIGTDGSPHPAGGSLGAAITARLTDRSPGGAVGCGFP